MQNIFLMQHHLVFVDMKYVFVQHQLYFCWYETLFSCDSNTFSSRSDYFLCNVKLFCFSTKLFFVQHQMFALHIIWNVMLWWYFLLSHSNKNIITCQKIIKSHFYVTKKLLSFFVHHNFFIFSFYIAHWQYVDLLCSGPGNKETFSPSFTHLSDVPNHLLSKSCSQNVWE